MFTLRGICHPSLPYLVFHIPQSNEEELRVTALLTSKNAGPERIELRLKSPHLNTHLTVSVAAVGGVWSPELQEGESVPDPEDLRKLSRITIQTLAKMSERLSMANGVVDAKGQPVMLPWGVATDLKLESGIGDEG